MKSHHAFHSAPEVPQSASEAETERFHKSATAGWQSDPDHLLQVARVRESPCSEIAADPLARRHFEKVREKKGPARVQTIHVEKKNCGAQTGNVFHVSKKKKR